MSIKTIRDNELVDRTLRSPDWRWKRPSDWLPMPSISTGSLQFAGLVAVFPGDDTTVQLNLSGGTPSSCTIDWGDGSPPVAGSTTNTHSYSYSSLTGTDSTRGYRQAIITVQLVAGTTINFTSAVGTGQNTSTKITTWLDVITDVDVIVSSGTTQNRPAAMLERIVYKSPATLSGSGAFYNCRSLRVVDGDLSAPSGLFMFRGCSDLRIAPQVTFTGASPSMQDMFTDCVSLIEVPLYDTSAVADFNSMFNGCRSLVNVPPFDTSNGSRFNSMFSSCSSIVRLPTFDLSNAGRDSTSHNVSGMFSNCSSLVEYGEINIPLCTSTRLMFSSCSSLRRVGPITTTSVLVNTESMFNGCGSLDEVPLFDTSGATVVSSMFIGCVGLTEIPAYNFSAATTAGSMFSGCTGLIALGDYNFSSISGVGSSSMLSSLTAASCLTTIGNWTFSSAATASLWGTSPPVNLRKSGISGLVFSHTYNNCNLGPQALIEIFNNLPTITPSSATITITNNWGAALLTPTDRAIATGKGWLISG